VSRARAKPKRKQPSPPKTVPKPLLVTPSPANVKGAWFDEEAVDRVVKFFGLLRQTKGRWRGKRFDLLPWQIWYVIRPIFGWKNADGTRIVRTAWIEVPRKQGKSSISSGLGLYLLTADREPGSEVFAAAGDKDQARIVFDAAAEMARNSQALNGRLEILRSIIRAPRSGGFFRALSHEARLKHGLNVSGALIDEVHVHKTRDLIDVLETGTGAREQPLIVFITTADAGEEGSIYSEKREYLENIAAGRVKDSSFYGVVYALAEDDDWTNPKNWAKANPGLDVTVKRDYIARQVQEALASPGRQNIVKRLHFGIRTKQTTRWLDMNQWDKNAGLVDESKLDGRECYGGLDLSATTDLTAFELIFPDVETDEQGGIHHVLSDFWLPEGNIDHLVKTTRVPYDQWIKDRWIHATEGNAIDYDAVIARILDAAGRYNLQSIGYDPWNAHHIVTRLRAEGIDMQPIRQGFASMSPPSKELERLLLLKRLAHNGHPVLRWMADVVEAKEDGEGNLKPVKPSRAKSSKRVDGIVALVMAISQMSNANQQESAYEEGDLEVI
jgi:phage terminase large subunit-like protein